MTTTSAGGAVRLAQATCRSCRSAIVWAKTPKGHTLPIDATPAADGKYVVASVDPYPQLVDYDPLDPHHADRHRFHSHFASCPQAGTWSRRNKSK